MINDRNSNFRDRRKENQEGFQAPNLDQMASMATNSLIIAKVAGADVPLGSILSLIAFRALLFVGAMAFAVFGLIVVPAILSNKAANNANKVDPNFVCVRIVDGYCIHPDGSINRQ